MSKIVRSSKYRHVFGTAARKEDAIDGVKTTRTAWDSNYAAANIKFWAVCWEAGGGGSFAVGTWANHKGKWDGKNGLVAGHKGPVVDLDWNPFNDNLIASASEDCNAKIWSIPDGGIGDKNMTDAVQTLTGHKRKIGSVKFHPTANNVLATSGADYAVKVWDIEKAETKYDIEASSTDLIQNCEWNYDGTLLVTASKDKKIRIIDPRQKKITAEAEAHSGVKGGRVIWLGTREKVFSVGFSKTSEREYALWDPKKFSEPLIRTPVDSASGVLLPFYDNDTSVLFLGGKGDGNIRYYEIVDESPYIHYLTEYKSNTAARGLAMLPKRAMNVSECEIARFVKVTPDKLEPISFQVPRKSDVFQDDIYPDTFGGEPSMTAAEYFGGKDAKPKTISLKGGFVAKEKPADFNPVQKQEEAPMTEVEMKKKIDELTKRVAYLESEVVKKDAKIKELQG